VPDPSDLDVLFQQAVAAIDAGDLRTVERLLAEHPRLASERLQQPGEWLQAQVGRALDGFFARPWLLWFVAEDPVRRGTLPPNIGEIARAIAAAARAAGGPDLQEQLDHALRLVAWSSVAARCGVQLALIDVLVDAGADPAREVNNALVNGHADAARHLLERGAILTFAAAACLDRWDDLERMAPVTKPAQRRFAFVLAALNGRTDALRRMLAMGADVNAPSEALYPHGTPLHHAVCSGSIEAVRTLVEAGADPARADTAWNGTPLGWAEYYVETSEAGRKAGYRAIAGYLRSLPPAAVR
jgi:peptide-methionine (S)-S-oxide reductase